MKYLSIGIKDYFSKLGEKAFAPINNSELIGVDTFPYLDAWEMEPDQVREKLVVNLCSSLSTCNGHHHHSSATSEETKNNNNCHCFGFAPTNVVIIDIREQADFDAGHLPGSRLLELGGTKHEPDPFDDAKTLARQWKALVRKLVGGEHEDDVNNHQEEVFGDLEGKVVIVVCYRGSTCECDKVLYIFCIADECFLSLFAPLIIDTARIATSILRHRGIEAYSVKGGITTWLETGYKCVKTATYANNKKTTMTNGIISEPVGA
jgi:rhodanese-related sulfurtransferase